MSAFTGYCSNQTHQTFLLYLYLPYVPDKMAIYGLLYIVTHNCIVRISCNRCKEWLNDL
jgi:hypothetical protein